MPKAMQHINALDVEAFTQVVGPVFENSPWIAQRTHAHRPFVNVVDLHAKLCETVKCATIDGQLALIRAHPDLVGRLAREGRLTRESTQEQAAAGLSDLSADEIDHFEKYNAAYREKFGFPFIICARLNRKHTILAAFPVRLNNSPEVERSAALAEVFKIAELRLRDLIED